MSEPPRDWPPRGRPLFLLSIGGDGTFRFSWQMLCGLAVIVATAVGLFHRLALKVDLDDHRARDHELVLEDRRDPITLRALAAEHHQKLKTLDQVAKDQRDMQAGVDRIQQMMFEDRADALAQQAARSFRKADREGVIAHIRATAIANQRAGRSILDGLERYFE